MSYSVCINCEQMVPMYEKYCGACLKRNPSFMQDSNFWRTYRGDLKDAKVIVDAELKRRPR